MIEKKKIEFIEKKFNKKKQHVQNFLRTKVTLRAILTPHAKVSWCIFVPSYKISKKFLLTKFVLFTLSSLNFITNKKRVLGARFLFIIV